jgi:tRNA threonylcarbamoyladenosine biosynthesis protein TsaE
MDAIFELSQIQAVAKQFLKYINTHTVWAFHAPMGAGKTTFIHALCNEMQIAQSISSPTFAIINEYFSPTFGLVYHMDWYRLKNEEEAINAGVEDMVCSGNICLIEWAENAPQLLPDNALHVCIEILDEKTRRIFIS